MFIWILEEIWSAVLKTHGKAAQFNICIYKRHGALDPIYFSMCVLYLNLYIMMATKALWTNARLQQKCPLIFNSGRVYIRWGEIGVEEKKREIKQKTKTPKRRSYTARTYIDTGMGLSSPLIIDCKCPHIGQALQRNIKGGFWRWSKSRREGLMELNFFAFSFRTRPSRRIQMFWNTQHQFGFLHSFALTFYWPSRSA